MRIVSRKKTKIEKISINDILPDKPYHFQFYWLDEANDPFLWRDFDGYLNNYKHTDTEWHFDFTDINGEHRGYVWDDGCFILSAYPLERNDNNEVVSE
jgi:hypothetical protein